MSEMVNTMLKIWAKFHFDMHYAVLSGVLSCTESSKDQYAVHKVTKDKYQYTHWKRNTRLSMRNSCLLLCKPQTGHYKYGIFTIKHYVYCTNMYTLKTFRNASKTVFVDELRAKKTVTVHFLQYWPLAEIIRVQINS